MEKVYIGCDPGAKGFMTFLKPNGEHLFVALSEHSIYDIHCILKRELQEYKDKGWKAVAALEEVHAIFGSSAKSTFSFGVIFGMLRGLFIAAGLPLHLVPPKKWQQDIWSSADKAFATKDGKRKVDTKKTSLNAARRLFPTVDLRRSPNCKKEDDNKCDSLLIAEYARMRNL